ncbi:MAG: NAD(P)H-hydrate dehydratase, partial [Polyangiaceae bacterium]|nr:NAD(P)H-hydrate dehydratase [Polyangiaceae bacterium]
MRPVLSRAQMRAYDRYAIETCHVPGLILMENAGRGAAEVIARLLSRRSARVVVACGAGNNGGDGFVAARHLLTRGANVHVALLGASERVTGDARINHDAYIDLGGSYVELGDEPDLERFEALLQGADAVVDALFGTGLARALRPPFAEAVALINRAPCHRIALDVPSGVDADSGAELGAAVSAHDTITFGHLKTGLLTPEGARYAGRVHVVGLGVPDSIVAHTGHVARVIDPPALKGWLSARAADVHKHRAGGVAVVAGSPGKTGAALLSAEAALRGGAGLSTLVTWPESAPSLEQRVRECMTFALDRARIAGSLDEALGKARVAVVGPGFGFDEAARVAVDHVVFGWDGVKVLDADGITLFAGRADSLARARGRLILTPHSGELGRLLGRGADDVERDRFGAAREAAQITRAVVVLKGSRSLVASSDELLVNVSGNPALATAGSGDVLAGLIGALACTLTPERAAAAGVFLHGAAADAWRSSHGDADRGLLASELLDYVPAVLSALRRGEYALGAASTEPPKHEGQPPPWTYYLLSPTPAGGRPDARSSLRWGRPDARSSLRLYSRGAMANSSQDTLPHVAGYEGASGPASGAEECLALAIVWSGAEPHRVGEITFVPPDGVARMLGRGGGEGGSRLHFVRQRPETLEAMPPLQGASMSRDQLRVTGAGDELRVERLGRCPMLVGGRTVNAAVLREGETVHVLEQLVLVVVKRPLRMPKLRFFPAARVPAFGEPDLGGIVGESPAVWKLRDDLALVAQFDRHVLVLGESGTGKELAARAVHELSGRRARRLVARNAATFPPGLVDAELFGNARNYPNVGMAERPG